MPPTKKPAKSPAQDSDLSVDLSNAADSPFRIGGSTFLGPEYPDVRTTPYQRQNRERALRRIINPHPVTQEELEDHLLATGYDVNAAYNRWLGRRNRIIAPSNEDQYEEVTTETASVLQALPPGPSEQERRRIVVIFRSTINESRRLNAKEADSSARSEDAAEVEDRPLQLSEAIMLLVDASWDITRARAAYIEHQLAFDEFTASYAHLRGPTNVQLERDQRLALLVNLTGRRDVSSVQNHFRRHNYNYIAAVVAWQKSGIPVVKHPEYDATEANIKKHPGLRGNVDRTLPTYPEDLDSSDGKVGDLESGSVWGSEDKDVDEDLVPQEPAGEDDEVQGFGVEGEEYEDNEVLAGSTLITEDREPAVVGANDPTKMIIEFFRNGAYKFRRFANRNFRWTNGDDDKLPVWSWESQKDLNKLNAWRRELFQRLTGEATRPRSYQWLPVEDDFLYNLHQERLDQLVIERPRSDPASFLPLRVPPERQRDWADQINQRFAGTLQAGADVPRPIRTVGAVNTHRARVDKIIEDFKVQRNNPRPDEANSDSGNDDEEDTDGAGQRGTKRKASGTISQPRRKNSKAGPSKKRIAPASEHEAAVKEGRPRKGDKDDRSSDDDERDKGYGPQRGGRGKK